jgi:hypothetical protein
MARRSVHLQIGLPGAGGDFVAAALSRHADSLRQRGTCVPAAPEEALHAALEITRTHAARGLRRRDVEGAWAAICRRVHRQRGDVVLGHDLFAAASPNQVALLLDGLAGLDVHVVLVASDPATLLEAGWAEAVAAGSPISFTRFRRRVLDPTRTHDQAHDFWTGHDLAAVAARWAEALGDPRRVHVVVPPAAARDPRPAIWQAMAELVGFEPLALPPAEELALDPLTAAVARSVNESLDGRLDARSHRDALDQHLCGGTTGLRALPPRSVYDQLVGVASGWLQALSTGGYDVIGDLDDLAPLRPGEPGTHAAEPPLEERLAVTTDALADLLVEASLLRTRAAELASRNERLERRRRRLRIRLAHAG